MINYRLSKFNYFGDCSYLYKFSFSGFKKNIKHFRWFYKNKIEAKVRHPFLINEQPVFKDLPKYNLPKAKNYVKKILQLPIHDNITIKEVDYVCKKLNSFIKKS